MTVFKKIFAPAYLGRWAFFSMLLAVLGTWSAAAWMTLAGVLFDFSKSWKLSSWFIGIFFILTSGAAVCNLAFFYSKVPGKFRKYFLLFCAVSILAAAAAGVLYGKEIAFYTALAAFFWILPLAVFHKKSYWVIPGSACYTVAAAGALIYSTVVLHFLEWLQQSHEFPAGETSWLLWCCLSIFGAFVFNAKLYAVTERQPLRKFFTPAMLIVLALWAAVYGISYLLAGYSERGAEKAIITFEKFSGFPTDVQGLYRLYYGNKKSDEGALFWKKARTLYALYVCKVKRNFRASHSAPFGLFHGKIRQEWKKAFLSSSEMHEMTELFSGPIPLPFRDYHTGKLHAVELDEFDIADDFARIQLWLLHFALEEKNLTQALAAFERLCKYKELMQNSFLYCLHFQAFNYTIFQILGMEKLLSSGLLKEDDLKKYLQHFEAERKKLSAFERKCIWGDTLLLLNALSFIAGKANFVFPPLKYFLNQVHIELAASFQFVPYAIAAENQKNNKSRYKIPQLLNFQLTARRFKSAALRLQLLETLLKLELEKQRNGSYPDKAPEWLPVDPYTGQKLHYQKGFFEITEFVYDPESKYMERQPRRSNAVAIWSSGPEKQPSLVKNTDFHKAVIRFPGPNR